MINMELPEIGNYTIQINDIIGKTIFNLAITNQIVVSIDVSLKLGCKFVCGFDSE